MNKNVAKEFKGLGQGIKNQLSAAAKPVQDSMLQLFKYISTSIKTMGPLFHSFFAAVAPLVTIIGHGLVQAVANLVGEFTPLVKVVTPIVEELFAQLPDLIGNIAAALHLILAPLSGNTAAFGMLLQTIGSLLPIVGSIIGSLVRLGQQIMPAFHQAVLAVGTALDSGLGKVLPLVGKAIQVMLPPVAHLISALLGLAAGVLPVLLPVLSKVVVILAGALAKVLPQILPSLVAVVGAFARLLPALAPLVAPVLYLAKSVSNLIPPLAQLAGKFIAALIPALKLILPLLVGVANQVGTALAKAFRDSAPSLVLLAKAASQVLVALTPLIPVVVKAALSFLPLIPAAAKIAAALAQGLVPIVLALTPLLIMLAPTLVKVALAAKLWSVAQAALNVVMALNPIGAVIVAVAALAAGIIYAYKHSETFRKIVDGAFKAIKTAVGAAVTFIITSFRAWWDMATTVVAGIIGAFGKLPGPMGAPFRKAEEAVRRAKTTVDAQLDAIQRRVHQLTGKNIPISASLKLNFSSSFTQKDWLAVRVAAGRMAKGGRVAVGSGPTADDVLARLSRGETVVSAADSARPEFRAWAAARRIPGYATGGVIDRIDAESRAVGKLEGWWSAKVLRAGLPKLAAAGGTGATGSVNQIAQMTARLLGRAGEWMAWARRIMFESGGNWSVVNKWDSNWFRGTPSVGGAQVIGPTFRTYAGPYRGVGPFLYGVSVNPLANSFAGGNYAVHRYGSLAAVDPRVRHAGYDAGGPLYPGWTMAWNGTGRTERVGPPGGTVELGPKTIAALAKALRDSPPVVSVDAVRAGIREGLRREGKPVTV